MINKLQSVNPLTTLWVFDVNLIFVYMIDLQGILSMASHMLALH